MFWNINLHCKICSNHVSFTTSRNSTIHVQVFGRVRFNLVVITKSECIRAIHWCFLDLSTMWLWITVILVITCNLVLNKLFSSSSSRLLLNAVSYVDGDSSFSFFSWSIWWLFITFGESIMIHYLYLIYHESAMLCSKEKMTSQCIKIE